MDPVCLHHDMSGLGGWEGIGWNRVGGEGGGVWDQILLLCASAIIRVFMNNLTKFFVTLFNISSTKKVIHGNNYTSVTQEFDWHGTWIQSFHKHKMPHRVGLCDVMTLLRGASYQPITTHIETSFFIRNKKKRFNMKFSCKLHLQIFTMLYVSISMNSHRNNFYIFYSMAHNTAWFFFK